MATAVHCLACFDVVEAHYDRRRALSLSEIEASYALYQRSLSYSSPAVNGTRQPASQRPGGFNAANSSASSSTRPGRPSYAAAAGASTSLGTSSAPLFVTWNTISDDKSLDDDDEEDEDEEGDHSLRGCIGTFESQPLSIGIPEYAIASSLQDTRFSPIKKTELPSLRVTVTLLTDFEKVDDPYDWEIGVHGIKLSFTDRGHRYGGTYLPNVAPEQRWNREETLKNLARKTGWRAGRSSWASLQLKVTRYRGRTATMKYSEYRDWKTWLASRQ
ncbi:hypothetical protein E4U22_007373 [Claviceps purpurea]|nr:hypothetical protein E4U28_006737 [Claviceps purpurea]KAG6135384.1 hypothetical protein E4U12_001731 [Claviceps purpurea]KAG6195914.1 hypothetical protein E4U10_001436 [Claviceps purpurea]KAG6201945.1 hypothetical protein E4U50_006511 [Claviceps purpurea]KAG6218746.1 hypothetical protein E4U34_003965 [Claviceps purpurea]